MGKKLISIFTPCFNEEGNIQLLYDRVTRVINNNPDYEYEWLIVDNKSCDRTREMLIDLAEKDRRVKLIFNRRNFGPNRSGLYGLFETQGDAAITLAADLQDPPELIPDFLKKWEEGYAIVLGRNIKSDENGAMRAARDMFYKILNHFSSGDGIENVTGFGLYDKAARDEMKRYVTWDQNLRYVIGAIGYQVAYIDYHKPERNAGTTSYSLFKYLDLSIETLVQISGKPVRIVTIAGAVVALLSVLLLMVCCVASAAALLRLDLVLLALWATFLAGCLALAIGLVGEYVLMLSRVLDSRPLVFEEARLGFDDANENTKLDRDDY